MKYGFALLLLVGIVSAQDSTGSATLTVHEWGTFTSVAGADGASLDWRPLQSSDLPSFVYTLSDSREGRGLRGRDGSQCKACGHDACGCGRKCAPGATGECNCCKTCTTAKMRMETPVLYFYPSREMDVSVKVGFPKGLITEWYPQAGAVKPVLSPNTPSGGVAGGEIDWGRFRVLPAGSADLPVETAPSHYYAARETDSALVRVCNRRSEAGKGAPEFERFLFYRGVGNFDLPVRTEEKGGALTVSNTGREPLRHLFAVRVDGKRVTWGYRDTLAVGEAWTATVDRDASIEPPVVKALTDCGLYEREATAMVKTWRDSWFEEDGVRVFYVVPSRLTEELLPLTITPKPASVVRVLVGRCEVLTSARIAEIEAVVARLGCESADDREAAAKRLKAYGRFAEPLLRRAIAESKDPEVRARCEALLRVGQ